MLLLNARNVKKYFGERLVLEFNEFSLYTGDKIGIVGANGVGKTTLLNLLAGSLEADEGEILSYGTISYQKQFLEDLQFLKVENNLRLLKELEVSGKIEQMGMSGGEETRLKLAGAIGQQKHILMLDEPTANLDMEGIKLLRDKLYQIETLLIISHDRALLDDICTHILEVSQGKLKLYPGNYSVYEKLKEAETERYHKEYETYIGEKKRLEEVYIQKKRLAEAAVKIPKGMSPREAHLRDSLCVSGRNHSGKQKSLNRAAEAVKKRIDHMEVKDKPKEEPKIRLNFKLTNPPENKILMEGKVISFSYGSRTIFDEASFQILNHKKIAIVGPNGAGKTTLLNLIKRSDEKRELGDGIRIVPKAVLGFLYQKLENLELNNTVFDNAMQDSVQLEVTVRSILSGFLFRADDLKKKVDVLSGGERMKLALAKLLVSNANVLILDEPTNYLDMPSIITLQKRMKEYEGTIIFVSHDLKFVNEVADELLIIKDHKITHHHGNLIAYEEIRKKEGTTKSLATLIGGAKSVGVQPAEEILRLELRMTQLLGELGMTKLRRTRDEIEEEYDMVLQKLQELKRMKA